MSPYYPPPAAGGGGLTAIPIGTAKRTAGNITVANTAGVWTAMDAGGGLDITLAAAAGDILLVGANFLATMAAGNIVGFDVATRAAGANVNWVSSAAAAPLVEGLPGWYPQGPAGVPDSPGDGPTYTVVAGDITAGNITLRPHYLGAGAATIFANANTPLAWHAINLKH